MTITPNPQQAQIRVGVDIGGTFTDVALEVGDRIHSTKVLTTHSAPEQAILDGLSKVAAEAGIALSDISLVIHGTTLATNALIERRGARTALITTEGFRDVLEMRTENRFEQYDLDITLPTPLIPRPDRFTLRERVGATGEVLIPLDDREVDALVDEIIGAGFESVAIGFIHSYLNGDHERRVRDALLRRAPQLSVSISSEVSPQMREYERFNTVCANAYVRPVIASYLHRLVDLLAGVGVTCPVLLMHSGGGIVSVDNAAAFPVRLMESGPAGGALFAADISERFSLGSVLSFDMGGTTAKICLIEDARPTTANVFEIDRSYRFKKGSGMPISIPVIEMVEIGAGGGSIATVDSLRQIRVGPHSAGSEPGPACYGRGGSQPTVTDADLLLGRLDPHNFAGGAIPLDPEASATAMLSAVGSHLDLDVQACAYGVSEVVDENMANAARAHAVENGRAIDEFTMIAFGGAAPVHAARLAEKLGITQVLIPASAGVGSAVGFLKAPFGFEVIRSSFVRLDAVDIDTFNRLLDDLSASVAEFLEQGTDEAEPIWERRAFMRYVGQGWEIPVDLPTRSFVAGDEVVLRELFDEAYRRYFGRTVEALPVEIVSVTVKASSPMAPPTKVDTIAGTSPVTATDTRPIFDAGVGETVSAALHERTALRPGDQVAGPAVIVEDETATVVTSSFTATVQTDGSLLLHATTSRQPMGDRQ